LQTDQILLIDLQVLTLTFCSESKLDVQRVGGDFPLGSSFDGWMQKYNMVVYKFADIRTHTFVEECREDKDRIHD